MIRSVCVCIAEATEFFYGYAQWKSAEQRDRAFASDSETISTAIRKMREAISESFLETMLEIIADYLILPEKN